ncbi:MAG TPA: GSU2403 family nucleotidyltransferase fold protein [Burkholderiales bacterium]|nr:GSU2403 family nucleotidyltransferase fold protein [Burkholderiales bacterium]
MRIARHDAASHARYQALKVLARSQRRVLPGAPGMLKRRVRGGTEYWVREFNRIDGRKADEHIGTVAAVSAAQLERARAGIELARALVSGSSALRLFGYQRVERRVAAVLAALFSHGLFEAGLTLVGSHAYGSLVNELGVAAPAYTTQDIDVARGQPLELGASAVPAFEDILADSGLQFVPVPGMPSRRPSGSFKIPGADALSVDLLVPGKALGDIVPLPELGTHAQQVPLLDFLVAEPIEAIVLGPNHVVPVRVPAPERFVLHKLISSQERKTDRAKARKDLEQAAAIAAALAEDRPDALTDAYRDLPTSARSSARRGAHAAASHLQTSHPSGHQSLEAIARRR